MEGSEKIRDPKKRRRDVVIGGIETIGGMAAIPYAVNMMNEKTFNAAENIGIHTLTAFLILFGVALSGEMLGMVGLQRIHQGITGRVNWRELDT